MFDNFEVPQELRPSDHRFACGPSLVPEVFLTNLANTGKDLMGTSHRASAVKNLVKETQENIAKYFQLDSDHEVILGNGGATCFFDMAAQNLTKSHSTHHVCGEFSQKWHKAHKIYPGIETTLRNVDFGQGITPEDDPQADLICATLNETSTGVQIDSLPSIHDGGLLAIDATSGGGQVPCDVNKTDCFFFSPQKVFASDGGLWVALMSTKACERAFELNEEGKSGKRYIPQFMDLKVAIENSRKNQTFTTPAIATIFMLNEQVKMLNEYGYERVQSLAKEKAQILYSWADEKPYLSCFVQDAKYRSNAVATIDVDEKVPVDTLVKRLADLNVATGIGSYRKLGRNQFRIASFHNITPEDLQKLTQILSLAIESKL